MKTAVRVAVGALLLAGGLAAPDVAQAAPMTAMGTAELQQLSPVMRKDVMARLKDGQTVHGVLETMLLNKVSEDFAARRIVASDFTRGAVVVEGKDGTLHSFPFDVETLRLRK